MPASVGRVSAADSIRGVSYKAYGEELPKTPGEDSSNTGQVDLDTVVAELGQFGPFQWKLMGLCGLVAIFAAWASSEYLFTAARINTRCMIPECDAASPEWYPPWVYSAIPTDGSALDGCRRYAPANVTLPPAADVCPAALFDRTTTEDCQYHVYENTYTIVYDYGLACDEWRRTLVGSMRTVGTMVGLFVTGYISDRWGRRVAVSFSAVNCAWLGVVRYWADTYVGFMVSEVIESAMGSGIYTSIYILSVDMYVLLVMMIALMLTSMVPTTNLAIGSQYADNMIEVIGAKHRTAASATLSSCWAVGQMTLGLIAWGVPNWRNLTLVLYIPQFVSILYFWLVPESARWYVTKGKYAESEAVLQKIASTNGKILHALTLEGLRQTADEDRRKRQLESMQKSKEPWLIVTVFRHKRILLRCIVAPVWWVTSTFIYYGLSINAVNIIGNRYLNYVAVSAVEIPGFWTAVLLVGKIGRKPVLTGAYWTCAACQVAYIFIPSDYYGVSLTFYLLGKYAIAVVATSLYIYTAELYPTKHRHTLFAFTSMVGRIGSIIAPLTPAIGDATFEELPFVLFGSFALLSGILMFLTPETRGTKLPDTMEEAENLHKA